ncbi:hypothetical protein NLJ89_g9388 [Agrocybe chaxingu]|uniref:Transcription elongation factor S-II n=1 Tax=Agrocybe chaxingu TaxID=84603 RepID=A0A9W8JTN0_9AGAR|nr:hypothetical protein NLJ89_g9388 [Agrocybe chaxingu]
MSEEVVELKKLVKQLQGAVNDVEILSILSIFREKKVTETLLRESKAGLAVGKLRSHNSKPVSDQAKEIVKQWKTAVDKAKAKSGASSHNGTAGKKLATPITPSAVGAAKDITSLRTAKIDGIKGGTGDPTRDRCVELIYDALACDATAPVEHVLNKARAVEASVHTNIGSTNGDYKGKIRTLFVNLKDKANPGLRASIVDGSLAPEKFAKMTRNGLGRAQSCR